MNCGELIVPQYYRLDFVIFRQNTPEPFWEILMEPQVKIIKKIE